MDTSKLLRYGVLAGVFLIPFLPLLVSSTMFFPFITAKNFAFRIVVELALGAWVVLAIREPAYRPKFSSVLAALAAFVVIIGVADVLGESPLKSIWSNFERMEGWVTLAHLLAYALVAGAVLRTERLWERFFDVSLGVSALLGVYGLFQIAGVLEIHQGGTRLDATFGNAAYLAGYMIFHIFLAAVMLARHHRNAFRRAAYIALLALQMVVIYYTATRGAILGLVGGALVASVLVALFERERREVRRAAVYALVGIAILVGGFLAVRATPFVKESPVLSRLASISIEGGSTRFTVWQMALAGAKERPLLGWGQENFNYVFNKYYEPSLYAQEPWFDRVHNVLLDWLIAGGVLGLLGYLALFLASLWALWGPRAAFPVTERALLTGMLAGYLFHNLFVFDNVVSYAVFASFLAYFHFRSARRSIFPEAPVLAGSILDRVAIPAALIVTLFVVYAVNVPGVRAAQGLLQAISPQAEGITKNLEMFKSTLALGSFADQEIREQLVQAALRVGTINVDIALKQEFFTLAYDEMAKQIKEAPNDARHYLFTGSLLTSFRQFDAGLPYFAKARELSPRKPSMLLALGSANLAKGDRAAALALFAEAFKLEPRYSEARVAYAAGLIYAGRRAEADALLTEGFGTLTVDSEQLVRAYFDAKLYDRVVVIWQGRVERNPTDPQTRVSLAAAHLAAGNRAAAVTELARAVELNPAFKEQGEFLIREIEAGRNP